MKKNNIILYFLFVGMAFFSACKAKFIGLDPSVEVYKVPAVTTAIDATGSASIELNNLSTFAGKVLVDIYFKDQAGPQKVDLIVRKNQKGGAEVKVVQAGLSSFPSTINISADQIKTLFGADLKVGDTYDFAADVYTKDGKFEAFPSHGPGSATSVTGAPNYSAFARFTVK